MKTKTVLVVILILLAAAGIPAAAQQSQAANGRASHVGLPVDWSFRQVMHHSANTPEFSDAAQAEPRVLYNWMYRNNNKKSGAFASAQGRHGRLKTNAPKAGLKVDWNFPLGIGTLAPNMFPAKYTFDPNATPSCSTDYVVYALNVQGNASQPNLVAFNNLYSGPTTTFNIGAPSGGATETGNVVTITTTATHNFTAGQSITIAGVTDTRYNGVFTVLASPAPTATKFSYTLSAFSGLPGSGNGTASFFALCGTANPSVAWAYNTATSNGTAVAINASPLGAIEAGSTVTITAPAHGLAVGQKVVISGVGVGGFNGYFTVATVPTANTFTYTNTSTGLAASGGGTVTLAKSSTLTSPFLSLDGTKMAFVETITTSGANDCGTGIAGPCSIFHVLTIGTTGSNGTFSGNSFTAATPGVGNNASLTSLVYTSAANTVSSPWIDYGRDNVYLGDDNGKVYQISCAFTCGTPPAFASGFSRDTGISVTAAATRLTAPVLFTDPNGAAFFKIFVGSSDGNLYMLPLGTCLPGAVANCVGKLTKAVGDGTTFGGIVDPPLVDPIFQTVFVGTGAATGGGNGGAIETNFALTTLGTLTAANKTFDVHQGALDNDYYLMNLNDATVKGHFYFAASGVGGGQLILNNAPFTKGAGNLTTANPPIFGAIASFNLTGHSTLPGSPMTEVFSNGVDNLIFGQSAVPKQGCTTSGGVTDGCMYRFNITSGAIPIAIDNDATQHGLPSGAVIDNVSTAAQASSVYFANGATTGASANAPTCTVGVATPAYCAVKLTQSALQ